MHEVGPRSAPARAPASATPSPAPGPAAARPALALTQTPSQTVGPFFGHALPYPGGPDVAPAWRADVIRFHGTVFDGAGDPIPDAIVEIWHPDAAGRVISERGSLDRDGTTVTGFGRAAVDRDGRYGFSTVKPGPARRGAAPYILVTVFARGLLHHLFTRAYFGDEAEANARDAFLDGLDGDRRSTLIAAAEPGGYRFDLRLQGEAETVFLDFHGAADV